MQTGGDLVNEGSLAEAVTTGFGVECVIAAFTDQIDQASCLNAATASVSASLSALHARCSNVYAMSLNPRAHSRWAMG